MNEQATRWLWEDVDHLLDTFQYIEDRFALQALSDTVKLIMTDLMTLEYGEGYLRTPLDDYEMAVW
jgi:hypothetical protein